MNLSIFCIYANATMQMENLNKIVGKTDYNGAVLYILNMLARVRK